MFTFNRVEYKFEGVDPKNYQTSLAEYVEQAADALLHPLGLFGKSYKISVTTNAKGNELIPGEVKRAKNKLSCLSLLVFIAYLTVPFAAPAGLLTGYLLKKIAGSSSSVAAKHEYIRGFSEDKLKQQLTSQLLVDTRLNGEQGSNADMYGMGLGIMCGPCIQGCGCVK